MCEGCCKEPRFDRGHCCLESGAYLVNFAGCYACGAFELTSVERNTDEQEDGEDYEEVITYVHQCGKCGHKICEHFYSFSVDDKEQAFLMECLLCGRGADTRKLDSDPNLTDEGSRNVHPSFDGDAPQVDLAQQGAMLVGALQAGLVGMTLPAESVAPAEGAAPAESDIEWD